MEIDGTIEVNNLIILLKENTHFLLWQMMRVLLIQYISLVTRYQGTSKYFCVVGNFSGNCICVLGKFVIEYNIFAEKYENTVLNG